MEAIEQCTQADPFAARQLLISELAKNRTPELLAEMGAFYRTAPRQYRDVAQAINYLQRTTNMGNGLAVIELADMFTNREAAVASPQRGLEILQRATTLGPMAETYRALGEQYLALGDRREAVTALEKAAAYGDRQAHETLAMLQTGDATAETLTGPGRPRTAAPAAPQRPGALLLETEVPDVSNAHVRPAEAEVVRVPTEMPAPDQVSIELAEATLDADALEQPVIIKAVPSTLTGKRLPLSMVISIAYKAGFRTEDQLLAAVAMAVAESGLWTSARNWKTEFGFRPKSDEIGVQGPPGVWSEDGRQAHADRGLWQISSYWWPRYSDRATDDPVSAATAVYLLSRAGMDFSLWDSFSAGRAQRHYERARDGWPALRPQIKSFLERQAGASTDAPRIMSSVK